MNEAWLRGSFAYSDVRVYNHTRSGVPRACKPVLKGAERRSRSVGDQRTLGGRLGFRFSWADVNESDDSLSVWNHDVQGSGEPQPPSQAFNELAPLGEGTVAGAEEARDDVTGSHVSPVLVATQVSENVPHPDGSDPMPCAEVLLEGGREESAHTQPPREVAFLGQAQVFGAGEATGIGECSAS